MKLNLMMQSFTKLALLFFTLGIFMFGAESVQAQTPPINIPTAGAELDGYMWSDTIGWISMNCKTGGVAGSDICATSNYKVTLIGEDSGGLQTGDLQGYAWSSNIGWIKFSRGYLSDFPVATGNVQATAHVTGDYTNQLTLSGWSRACSGTASGNCGNMVSRTDGWDGWISMQGDGIDGVGNAFNYGAKFAGGGTINNSFAWGGAVVGWLSLDQVTYSDMSPTATLSGTNCTILEGDSQCDTELTWQFQNENSPVITNQTDYSTYSNNSSGTNQPFAIDEGDNLIEASDNSGTLASITVNAACASGTDFSNGTSCELIPVAVAPTVTLTLNKKIARSGDVVTATWNITPAPPASPASCTLTGPGLTGTTVTSSGSQSSTALKSKTRFAINCTGIFGTVSASAEIEVIPVAMEV